MSVPGCSLRHMTTTTGQDGVTRDGVTRDGVTPDIETRRFLIHPQGAFSLRAAATFGFGQRAGDDGYDGAMRMAFCLDGYRHHVGVVLRETAEGIGVVAHGCAAALADLEAIRAQTARVLSLDHDADGYERVGERDPVVAALLALAPGLRPPLFHSPYEAAAWTVLSARRPSGQMMKVREELNAAHGAVFDLDGRRRTAFPTPEALLRVESVPGLDAEKVRRLHGVARAALDGRLDAAYLLGIGADTAEHELQTLRGIGPFSAGLVVVRGTGFADVLPTAEPRLLTLVRDLYGLPALPGAQEFSALAEPWRPFRTWVSVLIRSTGGRLLERRSAQ